MADTPQPEADENWWRGAVIYQVYPRSFADSNGDGTGDLAGVRSRLPYLAELGVDALWFNPWYPSPMADGGYDVADYRDIDPVFGTLAEAEKLISEAVALGIRTIIDIVPNHISAAHPWFREALAAGPGSAARERFWFRPGRGEHGELPPNNWPSQFGGPAWTRTTEPDGTPGDWFLNLFDSEQPDLNWNHPEVRAEHEDILRFWFDRGAGGVRIDSAAMVTKDPLLPDLTDDPAAPHPYIDRDDLHEIYRGWRRIADAYDNTRILVGEVWLPDAERFALYLRPDEMHTAFNFDFLACPWEAARLRTSINTTLAAHEPVNAPATWVLCNHDVTRTVTRYGRADTRFDFATKAFGIPTDLELGTRRARAAALLTLALPGSVYVYQGEELALPEVEDIPTEKLQDPMYLRSGGTDPGRDGCRVPIPWSGASSPFGFSPDGSAEPWLPQPADWAARTAEIQSADPASMLSLYRAALRLRRAEPGLGDGPLGWLESAPEVLAFRRGENFVCLLNLGTEPAELPDHEELLLTSGPLAEDGRVPADTAVWLRG
ncbi:glycoside hydrolase family 13 protein [Streptomyces sp. ITFR-21]|nr:glycoside hydrolase family 13 protein [Streptomyces sp. ITFR-21]WNI15259.1 glycoside hydrolase family 13 protein [Streptomyces sp. ITFR-21]